MAFGVWCLDEGGYSVDITLCYYNTVRGPTGGLILGALQKGHLQLSYLVTRDGWSSLNICAGCEAKTWESMYLKPRNHCDDRFLSLSWGRVEIKHHAYSEQRRELGMSSFNDNDLPSLYR